MGRLSDLSIGERKTQIDGLKKLRLCGGALSHLIGGLHTTRSSSRMFLQGIRFSCFFPFKSKERPVVLWEQSLDY